MKLEEARDQARQVLEQSKAGESTRQQYQRIAPRVLEQLDEAGHPVSAAGLAEWARERGWSKQTAYRARAAVQYVLAQGVRELARQADRYRKDGDRETGLARRRDAEAAGDQLAALREPMPRLGSRPRKSARRLLRPAQRQARQLGYSDWRHAVVDHARDGDRGLIAILAVTGARPAELAAGVELAATDDGRLAARIQSAKLDGATRELRLDGSSGLARGLYDYVAEHGPTVYQTRSAHALSMRVRRAATRAGLGINTYAFRHQFAADAKASGLSEDQLGAALGHTTDECQRMYGQAQLGAGHLEVEAEASHDVAHSREGPQHGAEPELDMDGPRM